MIPDYIAGRMDHQSLKKFSEHMENCRDCQEELTIQFLVTEGVSRLEDGSVFDLQGELDERLKAGKKKIRRYDRFLKAGLALEAAAAGCLAAAILWFLI